MYLSLLVKLRSGLNNIFAVCKESLWLVCPSHCCCCCWCCWLLHRCLVSQELKYVASLLSITQNLAVVTSCHQSYWLVLGRRKRRQRWWQEQKVDDGQQRQATRRRRVLTNLVLVPATLEIPLLMETRKVAMSSSAFVNLSYSSSSYLKCALPCQLLFARHIILAVISK